MQLTCQAEIPVSLIFQLPAGPAKPWGHNMDLNANSAYMIAVTEAINLVSNHPLFMQLEEVCKSHREAIPT